MQTREKQSRKCRRSQRLSVKVEPISSNRPVRRSIVANVNGGVNPDPVIETSPSRSPTPPPQPRLRRSTRVTTASKSPPKLLRLRTPSPAIPSTSTAATTRSKVSTKRQSLPKSAPPTKKVEPVIDDEPQPSVSEPASKPIETAIQSNKDAEVITDRVKNYDKICSPKTIVVNLPELPKFMPMPTTLSMAERAIVMKERLKIIRVYETERLEAFTKAGVIVHQNSDEQSYKRNVSKKQRKNSLLKEVCQLAELLTIFRNCVNSGPGVQNGGVVKRKIKLEKRRVLYNNTLKVFVKKKNGVSLKLPMVETRKVKFDSQSSNKIVTLPPVVKKHTSKNNCKKFSKSSKFSKKNVKFVEGTFLKSVIKKEVSFEPCSPRVVSQFEKMVSAMQRTPSKSASKSASTERMQSNPNVPTVPSYDQPSSSQAIHKTIMPSENPSTKTVSRRSTLRRFSTEISAIASTSQASTIVPLDRQVEMPSSVMATTLNQPSTSDVQKSPKLASTRSKTRMSSTSQSNVAIMENLTENSIRQTVATRTSGNSPTRRSRKSVATTPFEQVAFSTTSNKLPTMPPVLPTTTDITVKKELIDVFSNQTSTQVPIKSVSFNTFIKPSSVNAAPVNEKSQSITLRRSARLSIDAAPSETKKIESKEPLIEAVLPKPVDEPSNDLLPSKPVRNAKAKAISLLSPPPTKSRTKKLQSEPEVSVENNSLNTVPVETPEVKSEVVTPRKTTLMTTAELLSSPPGALITGRSRPILAVTLPADFGTKPSKMIDTKTASSSSTKVSTSDVITQQVAGATRRLFPAAVLLKSVTPSSSMNLPKVPFERLPESSATKKQQIPTSKPSITPVPKTPAIKKELIDEQSEPETTGFCESLIKNQSKPIRESAADSRIQKVKHCQHECENQVIVRQITKSEKVFRINKGFRVTHFKDRAEFFKAGFVRSKYEPPTVSPSFVGDQTDSKRRCDLTYPSKFDNTPEGIKAKYMQYSYDLLRKEPPGSRRPGARFFGKSLSKTLTKLNSIAHEYHQLNPSPLTLFRRRAKQRQFKGQTLLPKFRHQRCLRNVPQKQVSKLLPIARVQLEGKLKGKKIFKQYLTKKVSTFMSNELTKPVKFVKKSTKKVKTTRGKGWRQKTIPLIAQIPLRIEVKKLALLTPCQMKCKCKGFTSGQAKWSTKLCYPAIEALHILSQCKRCKHPLWLHRRKYQPDELTKRFELINDIEKLQYMLHNEKNAEKLRILFVLWKDLIRVVRFNLPIPKDEVDYATFFQDQNSIKRMFEYFYQLKLKRQNNVTRHYNKNHWSDLITTLNDFEFPDPSQTELQSYSFLTRIYDGTVVEKTFNSFYRLQYRKWYTFCFLSRGLKSIPTLNAIDIFGPHVFSIIAPAIGLRFYERVAKNGDQYVLTISVLYRQFADYFDAAFRDESRKPPSLEKLSERFQYDGGLNVLHSTFATKRVPYCIPIKSVEHFPSATVELDDSLRTQWIEQNQSRFKLEPWFIRFLITKMLKHMYNQDPQPLFGRDRPMNTKFKFNFNMQNAQLYELHDAMDRIERKQRDAMYDTETEKKFARGELVLIIADGRTTFDRPVMSDFLVQFAAIIHAQLPKMPRPYILKLLMNSKHTSLMLVKYMEGETRVRSWRVVGGICFRSFPQQQFSEIVFVTISTEHQVHGYGSFLMNELKRYHIKQLGYEHLLTFADNNAFGYFKKQKFHTKIPIPEEQYKSHIKYYDGARLMYCEAMMVNNDEEMQRALDVSIAGLSKIHKMMVENKDKKFVAAKLFDEQGIFQLPIDTFYRMESKDSSSIEFEPPVPHRGKSRNPLPEVFQLPKKEVKETDIAFFKAQPNAFKETVECDGKPLEVYFVDVSPRYDDLSNQSRTTRYHRYISDNYPPPLDLELTDLPVSFAPNRESDERKIQFHCGESSVLRKAGLLPRHIYIRTKLLLKTMKRFSLSWPFHYPVDEYDAPTYYKEVFAPMTLEMIENRLKNLYYLNLSTVFADFNRIFLNCYSFNEQRDGHYYHCCYRCHQYFNLVAKCVFFDYNVEQYLMPIPIHESTFPSKNRRNAQIAFERIRPYWYPNIRDSEERQLGDSSSSAGTEISEIDENCSESEAREKSLRRKISNLLRGVPLTSESEVEVPVVKQKGRRKTKTPKKKSKQATRKRKSMPKGVAKPKAESPVPGPSSRVKETVTVDLKIDDNDSPKPSSPKRVLRQTRTRQSIAINSVKSKSRSLSNSLPGPSTTLTSASQPRRAPKRAHLPTPSPSPPPSPIFVPKIETPPPTLKREHRAAATIATLLISQTASPKKPTTSSSKPQEPTPSTSKPLPPPPSSSPPRRWRQTKLSFTPLARFKQPIQKLAAKPESVEPDTTHLEPLSSPTAATPSTAARSRHNRNASPRKLIKLEDEGSPTPRLTRSAIRGSTAPETPQASTSSVQPSALISENPRSPLLHRSKRASTRAATKASANLPSPKRRGKNRK